MVRIKKKSHFFSTIELLLSLSILAIGITSIISLFPAGLNETNYSVGENYSAVSVNDMYAYITRESQLSSDYADWQSFLNTIPDSRPKTDKQKNVIMNTDNWGNAVEGNIYNPTNSPNDGIYGIKIGTDSLSGFSAQILIWESAIDRKKNKEQTNFNDWPEDNNNIAGINIETSWPLVKQYKDRFVEKYYFEVFNPNPNETYNNGKGHNKNWWWNKMQWKWAKWYNKWYSCKNNQGHGNNKDGVDVSNPSRGHGGPNSGHDQSGSIDDEKSQNNTNKHNDDKNNNGNNNHKDSKKNKEKNKHNGKNKNNKNS